MTSGESIAFFRAQKGLNQTELAAMVGVTQATISQLENGTRKIGKELADRIAIALGVALPKDILRDTLYKKIKRLSPKSVEIILGFVDLVLKAEERAYGGMSQEGKISRGK